MTTENIREFLERIPLEELKQRGVLRGTTNLLQGQSLDPLIQLMKGKGIQRLEHPESDWFLDVDGSFKNNDSREWRKNRLDELSSRGSVFDYTNRTINPYYSRGLLPGSEPETEEGAESVIFGLERDMQSALRQNIGQLESGLRIVDGGSERHTGGGWIDITAEDREGNPVVIELKADLARPESIAQVLAYMTSLVEEEQKLVRGILVAADFHPRVILAAKSVPNLQLKKYSFRFSFDDA